MKVFISWSGPLSHKVAIAFRNWLPKVLQSVEPYVSSEDIDKGTRWSVDVATELATSFYGILCVTRSNQSAPWLNFEAGALSKALNGSRVSPFLLDLKKSEVEGPLQQFQLTSQDKQDIKKLVFGIRSADVDCKLSDQNLDDVFEMWWPKLSEVLTEIIRQEAAETVGGLSPNELLVEADDSPLPGEILEEILQLSRQHSRALAGYERSLSDISESNLRRSSRFPSSEFSHPAVRDIVRSWPILRDLIVSTISDGDDVPDFLRSLERMDHAVEYLNRRSSSKENLESPLNPMKS